MSAVITTEKIEMAYLEDKNGVDQASLEKGDQGAEVTWTSKEEEAVLRKLDWNLIPL